MNLFTKSVPYNQFELSPIKAIELEAARHPGAVSLAQGIPSFQTPEKIIQYAQEKIAAGLCDKYSLTIGLTELREEIALALENEHLHYDPETEILVTAGSIEGITASLLAFTEPNDEVLLPSPSYASYLGAISIAKCVPRYVELDEDNNFDFHVENIKKCITPKTRLLLYCSPNNPTGTLFSEEKTRELIKICQRHNLTVLIDEVYKDFYYVDEPHFTPLLISEAREYIIRACSFSKSYAMTGWRVGFVHADKTRIRRVVKFHDAMVTCAPVPSQYAAIGALKYGEEFLEAFKQEFKRRRNYCIHRLDELSQVLDYQLPKATYFVFPRIKDIVRYSSDSKKLAYDILEKVGVATVPGRAFGPSGESHLRINFGREMHDLEEGLDRLENYFSRYSGEKTIAKPKTLVDKPVADHPPKSISPTGKIVRHLLARSSRNYLKSNAMTVIGIAGIKGKTTVKRTLVELLSKRFTTRGNVLSYNTDVGLPLSILRLAVPKTKADKCKFPFQLLFKGHFSSEHTDILVLEYGIRSRSDAETLLAIARPDWLIISGIQADPYLDYTSITDGIEYLASQVKKERILWVKDDPYIQRLNALADSPLGITDSQLHPGKLLSSTHEYACTREAVGVSAARALILSVEMAEQLGIPNKFIAEYLLSL